MKGLLTTVLVAMESETKLSLRRGRGSWLATIPPSHHPHVTAPSRPVGPCTESKAGSSLSASWDTSKSSPHVPSQKPREQQEDRAESVGPSVSDSVCSGQRTARSLSLWAVALPLNSDSVRRDSALQPPLNLSPFSPAPHLASISLQATGWGGRLLGSYFLKAQLS